jgi:hypothetical protein
MASTKIEVESEEFTGVKEYGCIKAVYHAVYT